MTTLHAHVETYATDCDGAISNDYIATMNEGEDDLDFHNRMVASTVNTYSLMAQGALKVTRFEDGDVRMEWTEQTEEGSRYHGVTFCTDDCDTGETHYRDHRAEEMGY